MSRKRSIPPTQLSFVPHDDMTPPRAGEILLRMPLNAAAVPEPAQAQFDADAKPVHTLLGAEAVEIELLQPWTPDIIWEDLGLVPTMPLYTIRIPSPCNWSGYTLECVGIRLNPNGGTLQLASGTCTYMISLTNPLETPPSEELPLFVWSPKPGFPLLVLLPLRRRVYREGYTVYLEARWTPMEGETIKPVGVEKGTPSTIARLADQAADLYKQGIRLLRETEVGPGRETGTGYYPTLAAFHTKYLEVYLETPKQRQGKGRVRDEDLWPLMGLSKSSFYGHVRKYGRPVLPQI